MPSNRRDIPREDRVNAILDVATRLFVERGFGETTVADVARQAGVRNGTVHWYFPSKDDLLAAVMLRAVRGEYDRAIAMTDVSPRDQLIVYLTDLRPFRDLRGAVRERARTSESVAEAQREMGEKTEALVARVLETGDSWCDPETATNAILAAFEGSSLVRQPRLSGTEMVTFLLDRVFLVPAPGAH